MSCKCNIGKEQIRAGKNECFQKRAASLGVQAGENVKVSLTDLIEITMIKT